MAKTCRLITIRPIVTKDNKKRYHIVSYVNSNITEYHPYWNMSGPLYNGRTFLKLIDALDSIEKYIRYNKHYTETRILLASEKGFHFNEKKCRRLWKQACKKDQFNKLIFELRKKPRKNFIKNKNI